MITIIEDVLDTLLGMVLTLSRLWQDYPEIVTMF